MFAWWQDGIYDDDEKRETYSDHFENDAKLDDIEWWGDSVQVSWSYMLISLWTPLTHKTPPKTITIKTTTKTYKEWLGGDEWWGLSLGKLATHMVRVINH